MIASFFRMTRPGNVLIATLSVWLGAWIAGARIEFSGIIIDGLVLGFLAAIGNLHNDLVDQPVDRINRPDRPLPAKKIEVWAVWFGIIALLVVSILLLAFRSYPQWIFASAVLGALYIYNTKLKSLPLVGNMAVSALCASALWMPALDKNIWSDISTPDRLVPLVFFSFLFTFVRELIKDIEDMQGDSALGMRTLPLLLGEHFAKVVSIIVLLLGVISTVWPSITGVYPISFVITCAVFVYPLLILTLWNLRNHSEDYRAAQQHMKLAMIGGIVASVVVFRVFPLMF